MRFLVTVKLTTENANKAVEDGTMGAKIQAMMEALKPEAAYFLEDDGVRTTILIVDIADASRIPSITEPFFLGMNAKVSLRAVMSAEDLGRAGLAELGKTWGSSRVW